MFKFWILCVFEPPPFEGGLGTTYDVHLGLIGKRVMNFLLALIELLQCGLVDPKFQVEGMSPPIIFTRIVNSMNALQLCR